MTSLYLFGYEIKHLIDREAPTLNNPNRETHEMCRNILRRLLACCTFFGFIAERSFVYIAHRFAIPLDLIAVPVIEDFLGRQDELDKLWQYLLPKRSQSRKVVILHGLGGIGKTQLAIRFARDHKHDFTAVFWLNGNDRSTLLHSLSSIFLRLPGQSQNIEAVNDEEVEQRGRYVSRWLTLEETHGG